MITKKVKYIDYDGNEREEEFCFNLTKAELAEMELSTEGGLEKTIKSIVEAKDGPRIMKLFKDILLKSYGEKSLDGRRFAKVDEDGRPLSNKFVQTEAYSQIFMELVTDADAAAAFINGVIPSDLVAQAKATPNPNHPALKG